MPRLTTTTAPIIALLSVASAVLAQDSGAKKDATTPDQQTAHTDAPPAHVLGEGILPIPTYAGDVWDREFLTGDWNGARTQLADKGIQIKLDWVQTVQSVVDGGNQRGTRYGGSLDYIVDFDLDKMGLVPGGLIAFRAETRYGDSVNDMTGLISPVSTDAFFPLSDDDIPITISDLTYYQFFSDSFGVFLGKIDTLSGDLNPFASGRGNQQFMNQNFVFNSVATMTVPYSTLAAGLVVNLSPNISITSTVMNTADASTTTGFQDFGDGWTWSTEANFQYALGELPGGQNISALIAGDNQYLDIGGRFSFQPGQGIIPPTDDDSWAVMWSGWQYLYTKETHKGPVDLENGPPNIQGFGLFARAGFADKDTNPVEWSISGGIGGQGIIPGRDYDRFGVGYFYSSINEGRLSSAFALTDNSQGFEAFYMLAVTRAAELTFDLQVVDGLVEDTDPAVVLGLRLFINF